MFHGQKNLYPNEEGELMQSMKYIYKKIPGKVGVKKAHRVDEADKKRDIARRS